MKKTMIRMTALAVGVLVSGFAVAQTYTVDRYEDDSNKGSLRWAIEQSNANTAGEVNDILIQPVGKAPYVIKLKSALPELKNPVHLIGEPWAKNGEYVAIDGSGYIGAGPKACPGATEGQYGANVRTMTNPALVLRDINGNILKGLEIRNFCIAVIINRSSNNVLQHNRIVNSHGGAGVMLTGDDGKGNPTATTTNNNKIIDNYFQDNGDGLELTRGAAFNLVANNVFTNSSVNPEPSQGIEILWGNDNAVVNNLFENYSDGLQINWGKRNYIGSNELRNNSTGLNLTGDGNIIDNNRIHGNRLGIGVRSEKDANAHITLTRNQIWDNFKDTKRCYAGGACIANQRLGAIIFDLPGLEHAKFEGDRGGGISPDPAKLQKTCSQPNEQGCNAMPNQNIQAPLLSAEKGKVRISLTAQPNQSYHVELFGNKAAKGSEAEAYLGAQTLVTDDKGQASALWSNPNSAMKSITASVTDNHGATSELSRPFTF